MVAASWAPDDTAFAYVGHPEGRGRWRLYAGRTLDQSRGRAIPFHVQPGQLLGCRDNRHVVVGHYRTTVQVVDVVTGRIEALDMRGAGEPMNAPLLAADLWRNPLASPVEPDGTSDPRLPFRWSAGALLVLLVLLVLLAGAFLLRRRRARG